MNFGYKVRPRTVGCVAMCSAVLFILMSRLCCMDVCFLIFCICCASTQFEQGLRDRCDSSIACRLCRFEQCVWVCTQIVGFVVLCGSLSDYSIVVFIAPIAQLVSALDLTSSERLRDQSSLRAKG